MPSQSQSRKRFLVAPLDWGLGHATRCIPVIRALREFGHETLAAATGPAAQLLAGEFAGIPIVPIVGYSMRYAASPFFLKLKFPFMVAKVYACARREHREIERLVEEHRIDVVISDQRFGCHTKKARSIYISHQLCVLMPRAFAPLERLVARELRRAAGAFDQLWIPDMPGDDNLTGDLTRKYPLPSNHRFIGPLSRFGGARSSVAGDGTDLVVMLSGPEPQRSAFERAVLLQLKSFDRRAVVLLGTPGSEARVDAGANVEVLSHLATDATERLLRNAGAIVCRGGYTSIMELVSLGRKAVLVPTAGQSEQEYLCERLARKQRFVVQKQSEFNLNQALEALEALPQPPPAPDSAALLRSALQGSCP